MITDPTPATYHLHINTADGIFALHFWWWVSYITLCLAIWEVDKALFVILLVSVFTFPPLVVAWLVGTIKNVVHGRWRRAVSAFLGPPLAGVLFVVLSALGLDPDRIHFLLVKYPHQIEVSSTAGEGVRRNWSWGLDAAPLSPGVAYTLTYDPTDAESHLEKRPDKSVRPMGDHFYVVKESEDGSPL